MVRTKTDKIRLGCEIALSIATVILAVVFIAVVANIYFTGKGQEVTYSRDIVWSRLKWLIAPIVIWVLGVIACFVLSELFPAQAKKSQASAAERVRKLRNRVPRQTNDELKPELSRYRTYGAVRIALYAVAAAFAVGTAIYAIVYLCNGKNFTDEVNASAVALVRNVFPFIAVSMALFIGASLYEHFIAKKELQSITNMLVICKNSSIATSPLPTKLETVKAAIASKENIIIWCVRGAVFVLAVVFIGIGIANGGVNDVWDKAVALCKECIGMG